MFCPSCGVVLAQQLKYCNRCGSNISTRDPQVIQLLEKRMDSEMEGLFWITVFGLGFILGGIAVMKKLQLSEWLMVTYMGLCAAAFVAYFGLGVWQVRRLSRSMKETGAITVSSSPDTNELGPAPALASLEMPLSVTEHTTRTLEAIPKS